ncbi:MAG: hypothetical protein AAF226_16590 [Verrucomicrobiota bacterium]
MRTNILKTLLFSSMLAVVAAAFTSCATTPGNNYGAAGTISKSKLNSPAVQQRNAMIAQEPAGNYYIGRRWWTEGARFWGYLRRPGQTWDQAKLVMINEGSKRQPDRLNELGPEGARHGYDHNHEYKIYGSFTGATIYDPNSNFELPEFRLTNYELISKNPGFLFYPGEPYSRGKLPPLHPPVPY